MFDDFDTNISAEEFYSYLYNFQEVKDYEREERENQPSTQEVSGRISRMASL